MTACRCIMHARHWICLRNMVTVIRFRELIGRLPHTIITRDSRKRLWENLKAALQYVNWHHEKYYHCTDTTDRLQVYVPDEVRSTELKWIADEGIKTVPEWILRLREQLSRTYAAMGCKQESDYNRNVYLDLLDYTRQDKAFVESLCSSGERIKTD